MVKVAEYISQFLVDKGIKDCFMVTGGGAMHLDDAFGRQEGLNLVFNHNEQGCSIAAEAYARLTGNIASVCVTSGPGGTNAITGVMGGWLDSIPMFVVSGQVKRETTIWSCPEIGLRQLGDQEFNIVDSVSNMTKYAVMVTEPNDIAYHLEKAFYLANTGRPGPVWIDVPLDVQGAKIETNELKHFSILEEKLNPELKDTIEQVLEKIDKAKKPLLLLGTGVRIAGAADLVEKLTETLQIPTVLAWNANDLMPYDSPYYVGMPGTVGMRSGNFAVQNSDLIISIGCRLNIRMIGYNRGDFGKNAYKIIVDIDEKELKKPTIIPDMGVCADAKDFIEELLRQSKETPIKHENWLNWCKELLYKYPTVLPEYYNNNGEDINPYVFMDELFNQLEEGDRIACGNGSACVVTFQAAKIKKNQRMFTNSGCAAMGYGLPAAVGIAVSDNSKRTICLDGDGSVMMNIQELATIAHNKLDVKLYVLCNEGYHSIRQTQTNIFKSNFVGIDEKTGVGFPNFEKLAEAFGLGYYRITNNNCKDVLRASLSSQGPCLCEVILDAKQNFSPKSSSKVLPDGRIVSPSLDDMAPFLDREEYEGNHYNG